MIYRQNKNSKNCKTPALNNQVFVVYINIRKLL